jgi:hypothetical protein
MFVVHIELEQMVLRVNVTIISHCLLHKAEVCECEPKLP